MLCIWELGIPCSWNEKKSMDHLKQEEFTALAQVYQCRKGMTGVMGIPTIIVVYILSVLFVH